MSDLVKRQLPASFVLSRAVPTLSELLYGVEHGWLAAADCLAIARNRVELLGEAASLEVDLASIGKAEEDEVWPIVERLRRAGVPESLHDARFWMFLILAWTYENRDQVDDPFRIIEMLYADFGYPDEIESFVPYMPARPGEDASVGGLESRWKAFLERTSSEYAHRRVSEWS
jgi:hypothetical protein